MQDKLEITKEMVESFAQMINSSDGKDTKFAIDIFENRDKDNLESETNFKNIGNLIINNDQLFPTGDRYVIKVGDKILTINQDRTIFNSIALAERALSRHMSEWIGSPVNTQMMSWQDREFIKYSGLKDEYLDSFEMRKRVAKTIPKYDPDFNKKEFVKKWKINKSKELGHNAQVLKAGGAIMIGNKTLRKKDINYYYFQALKEFFSDGKELRNFLIKNKFVEIVKL